MCRYRIEKLVKGERPRAEAKAEANKAAGGRH
jgi:hypothetical protein